MSEATLASAVMSGEAETVRRILEQGADVNARNKNDSDRTPIFNATDVSIMQMLIANGAQVNLKDDYGWTPLHMVAPKAGRGDVACCEFLLSKNASIEATTRFGSTPLHLAASNSNVKQVDILLAHQRSRHGSAGVGSLLLKTRTTSSRNALHSCALSHEGTSGTARLLVEHCRGEDGILLPACHQIMTAKDLAGFTPLDLAKVRNSTGAEVAEYLEGFTTLPLAASPDACGLAVMLNPKLDDFQRAIAIDCSDLIHTCDLDIPDAAGYIILGYLSSCDVMKR